MSFMNLSCLQICIHGNNHNGAPNQYFFIVMVPITIVTIIGFVADILIYQYVKNNSFNSNKSYSITTKLADEEVAISNKKELTEYQKLLLRIPLNSITASFISMIPLVLCVIFAYVLNVTNLTKFYMYSFMFFMVQGFRGSAILRCLFSAHLVNVANKKAERQNWERENAFMTKKAIGTS